MNLLRGQATYLLLLLAIFSAAAQSPDLVWQHTIGGSNDDRGLWIEQSADGGYFLGGHSTSDISGEKSENNIGIPGSYDYWVMRLDADGNIVWQNTIGGAEDDQFDVLRATPDGGCIIGGSSHSNASGDKTSNVVGEYDYWIVKLDADGNIQWQQQYGSDDSEVLTDLNLTDDGGYIIGGISGGNISGDKTEDARGDVDYWIIKTDHLGNIVWQRTIGGNKEDYLYTADQTSDGGFIIGGSSKSTPSGERTLPLTGTSDMWFLKLDASGNIMWQNHIGSNVKDRLNALFETADGGYMIGGYSAGGVFADKTENSLFIDYWILKLDDAGDILWQNTIGGPDLDLLNTARPAPDGGMIAVGSSTSNAFADKTEDAFGGLDYWIVKVDDAGNVSWDKTLGGSDDDEPFGICVTTDGDYMIAGYSNSGISGNKTEMNRGAGDYWLVKLGNAMVAEPCSTAPEGSFADNITPVSAKLHWLSDAGALKYLVRFRQSGTPAWTAVPSGINNKNISGLMPSTAYEFQVRSFCGPDNKSGWSTSSVFTTSPLRTADTCEASFTYSIVNTGLCELTNTTAGAASCGAPTIFYWEFCGDDPTNVENPYYEFTDTFCICLTVTFTSGFISTTCSDTLLYTALEDIGISDGLFLYPNPVADLLFVSTSDADMRSAWKISDLSGRQMDNGKLHHNIPIDVHALPAGMYVFELDSGSRRVFVKE